MLIRLRPYERADSAALHAAARESVAEVHPWLPWCRPEYEMADSEAWIERQIQSFADRSEFEFVVESPEGDFLGGCGLNHIDSENRRCNVGYWVRSSRTRRGVGSQAMITLADWAFANTNLVRLEIIVAAGNEASLRVARNAGADEEGRLRSRLMMHGELHDAFQFAVIRPDSPVL